MTLTAPPPARTLRATLRWALASLCFVAALSTGLDARRARSTTNVEALSYLPDKETLDKLSFGYQTFVADLAWIQALQRHRPGRAGQVAARQTDAILHLDPDFKYAYQWAGNTLIFGSGRITKEGVLRANDFLLRGMQRYPDEAYYPYTIGLNYAFYYPAESKPEKAAMMAKGIEFLQLAMQRPDAPHGTALLVSSLFGYRQDRTAQLDFLEQAYVSEADPEVRRKIEGRIRALSGADRRRIFERERRRRDAWLRQGFDYLDPGLAYLVGAPLARPLRVALLPRAEPPPPPPAQP